MSKQHFFKRYAKFSWLLINGLFILCFLVAAELLLGMLGYKKGMCCKSSPVRLVDSLVLTKDFYTDDRGLFVAKSDYFRIYKECGDAGFYINTDGFRSAEFSDSVAENQTQVLFLGDSFTWGGTARPLDQAFVDIINRQPEYYTYNTGIPGADPAQYAAIAQRYIPQLQPDIVCVVFFMGNDIMWHKRPLQANQDLYYWTNAGALLGYKPIHFDGLPNEAFPSPQAAYDYILDKCLLCAQEPTTWQQYLSSTRISTGLACLHKKMNVQQKFVYPSHSISDFYIQQIQDLCAQQQIPLLIFLIPPIDNFELNAQKIREKNKGLFVDIPFHIPNPWFKRYYYEMPNGHLTNQGHEKYARFIQTRLDSIRQAK